MSEELTPAEQAELRFLRGQVDLLQEEMLKSQYHPNIKNDFWRARKELKEFVYKLRQKGRRI